MASIFPSAGPTMPEFRTLLVQGCYHASAPVYLALSYVQSYDAAKVILSAPSRSKFTAELRKALDNHLKVAGGTGKIARAARRVEMLYPPTPAHLALVLSLFHEALNTEKDFLHQKTTFSVTPSLIVLCELSSYFLESPDATVSSYLTAVSQAMSCVSSLSDQCGKNVAFALFDSGLERLRLPILTPASHGHGHAERESTRAGPRRESVALLVRRYFEWIGTVEEETDQLSAETLSTLRLTRTQSGQMKDGNEDLVWQWKKGLDTDGGTIYMF